MQPFGNMDGGADLAVIMAAHQRARDYGFGKGARVLILEKHLIAKVVGFNFARYMHPSGDIAPLLVESSTGAGKCAAEALMLVNGNIAHDPFGRMPDLTLPPGYGQHSLDDEEDDEADWNNQ